MAKGFRVTLTAEDLNALGGLLQAFNEHLTDQMNEARPDSLDDPVAAFRRQDHEAARQAWTKMATAANRDGVAPAPKRHWKEDLVPALPAWVPQTDEEG